MQRTCIFSQVFQLTNMRFHPLVPSASYDTSVKLWELERGNCIMSLTKHQELVCSVTFSPDGKYLASGSYDRALNVWSTQVRLTFLMSLFVAFIFVTELTALSAIVEIADENTCARKKATNLHI